MKYRIKVKTMKDGSKVYTSQRRSLFMWFDTGPYDTYYDLESAKRKIDFWIETNNRFTVDKTEYIKYP
jgi:hypothetical protein